MFDVVCHVCGEPWDNDELHVEHMTYSEAFSLFKRYGCNAFDVIMGWEDEDPDLQPCRRDPIYDADIWSEIQPLIQAADDAEEIVSIIDMAEGLGYI